MGISVPSGYGQIVMSDWLIEFKRLYPGIVLDVLFENRTDHLRDEVDIAIRVISEPPLSVVARSLGAGALCGLRLTGLWPARHGCRARCYELRNSAHHHRRRAGAPVAPGGLPGARSGRR